jgi:biopolymer transport protein ExbB
MMGEETGFSLLTLFKMGGVFMWPLLAFSIATISITIERIIYIFYSNIKIADLQNNVRAYIREGNLVGAKEYLKSKASKNLGARILLKMIKNYSLSSDRLERVAEQEAGVCISSLENGLDYLVALGSISPLTGFLGTVSGMIGAFKSIAEATEVNAQIVAGGIYEALITTVFGLIIAIIAMIANSLFAHKIDRFAGDVEKTCSVIVTDKFIAENTAKNSFVQNYLIEKNKK